MATRSAAYLLALTLPLLTGSLSAQPEVEGKWWRPFKHDTSPATLPPPPLDLFWKPPILNCRFIPLQDVATPSWVVEPQYRTTVCFNAIHMSLIPKGPNQGKVMVFDSTRAIGRPFRPGGTRFHAQRWAILDPEAAPPQFKNHTLQIPIRKGGDLFCAGHCWDHEGNLFVVGGSNYEMNPILALKVAYSWDPSDTTQTPDGTWNLLPDMIIGRWYPTVTLLADPSNLIMVTGGVNQSGATSTSDTAYNTYEVWDPSQPVPSWQPQVFRGPRWNPNPLIWDGVHPIGEARRR